MVTQEQVNTLYGREVYDRDGDKIGKVGAVWSDAVGQPSWASVQTGLFGLHESLVPLQDADVQGDRLVVPFDKATVKDAPNVDASHDEPLTRGEVDRLYEHYGIDWNESYRAYQAGSSAGSGYRDSGSGSGESGYNESSYSESSYNDTDYTDSSYNKTGRSRTEGRHTDTSTTGTSSTGVRAGNDAMTRSEERLTVGTEREEAGRARLRKYVTTETEQVEVPVQREEVRLEREPITDVNRDAAFSGPAISESEHEVTLHAERPVVETEAVPVERVRLGKETVTDQQTVGGEVRKEHIEADLPNDGRGRRTVD
ncbi:DUF2382 domain-containing protein [Actinoplanes sp. GCM10030250]|uniref:DUF2382 domain-containing protein n=1 Tax=Actinoplanes sp. GCM10030250 TaxID=3273376 RepID=UPI003611B818